MDKLLYVPTFVSPFKQKSNKISSQDKIAMINLALEEKNGIMWFWSKTKYCKLYN
ncbi:hypothetical protein NW064_04690 [Mycoplasmopsis felis]|uniref:hypothetical protein n=1 Tax=Mycoplasmopsis felis TaxID=33923 RepID=UPI0021AEF1C0|nr:hypothetical protein [Mycoplasmopsis felis]UWW00527.1 hypothetical protein NW064_04690 [Mycoplasmopsis felis]